MNYLDSPSSNNMFIHPVSYEELNRLITCLNTSKSAGADNIGHTLVKTVSAYICD